MADERDHRLVLVRATKRRGGQWAYDDYDVRRTHRDGPEPCTSFCCLRMEHGAQSSRDRGYASTREEAMIEFKRAWRGTQSGRKVVVRQDHIALLDVRAFHQPADLARDRAVSRLSVPAVKMTNRVIPRKQIAWLGLRGSK